MPVLKKISIAEQVKKDSEEFNRIVKTAVEAAFKARDEKHNLEMFLLSWGLLEQIVLPSLIRLIAHRLKLNDIPKLEKMRVSVLIDSYFFLSHDAKLYSLLKEGNRKRNDLIHKMYKSKSLDDLNNEADKVGMFILKKVIAPVIERLQGSKEIPVLNLYANGWNNALKECLKIVRNEKK